MNYGTKKSANRLHFPFLGYLFYHFATPSVPPTFAHENPTYCDAPAPTDFAITDQGANSVTLGWTPAVSGAPHTLLVYRMDVEGEWIQIFGNNSVSGTSYTLYDLQAGSYEARIYTNCVSGEASIF